MRERKEGVRGENREGRKKGRLVEREGLRMEKAGMYAPCRQAWHSAHGAHQGVEEASTY